MTFRGRTMQALHVVMLFIVELLLTFPLSSEYKKIFFFGGELWHVACRISVPWPGNEPSPLTMRAQSPNHWTARELPGQISWERHREEHIFLIPSCLNVILLRTIKTTFPGQQSAVKSFHLYILNGQTQWTQFQTVWKFENSGYSKICLFLLKVNYQERKRKSLEQTSIDFYFKESLLNQIWWKNFSKGSKGFIYGFILNIYWTMQRDQQQSLEPNCLDSNPDSTAYDVRVGP